MSVSQTRDQLTGAVRETLVASLDTVALIGYLVYSLVKPDKF